MIRPPRASSSRDMERLLLGSGSVKIASRLGSAPRRHPQESQETAPCRYSILRYRLQATVFSTFSPNASSLCHELRSLLDVEIPLRQRGSRETRRRSSWGGPPCQSSLADVTIYMDRKPPMKPVLFIMLPCRPREPEVKGCSDAHGAVHCDVTTDTSSMIFHFRER